MLDSLRAFSRTWFAQDLLRRSRPRALPLFGISNVIFDLGTSTVARVGDQEITIQRVPAGLSVAAQPDGPAVRPGADRRAGGGARHPELGDRPARRQRRDRPGRRRISASASRRPGSARCCARIRLSPARSAVSTAQNFVRVLQQIGYTEAEYFEIQTQGRARASSSRAPSSPTPPSRTRRSSWSTATRPTRAPSTTSSSTRPACRRSPIRPTRSWRPTSPSTRPSTARTETRTVDLVVLTPETLAAHKTITDEEIAAEYERTKDSLTRPERRTIRQVVLPDDADRRSLRGRQGRRPHLRRARHRGRPAGDRSRHAGPDRDQRPCARRRRVRPRGSRRLRRHPGHRRQARDLRLGDRGRRRSRRSRKPAPTSAASWRSPQARNEYTDILDQVEELRAAFQPLTEIADALRPHRPAGHVTAAGAGTRRPCRRRRRGARHASRRPIFDAELGELASTVGAQRQPQHLVRPQGRRAGARPDARRSQGRPGARDHRGAHGRRGRDRGRQDPRPSSRPARRSPTSPLALNQFAQLSQPITRNGDGTPVLDRAGRGLRLRRRRRPLRRGAERRRRLRRLPGGRGHPRRGRDARAGARASSTEASRDTLYSDFVTGLRDEVGVRVNQQALNQVLALDTTTGQ